MLYQALDLFGFFESKRENSNKEKPVTIITMFLVTNIEFGMALSKIFSKKYKSILRHISVKISTVENFI